MISVDKAIASVMKTGKVVLGANSTVKNAKTGKTRLIVLADNCPRSVREDIEHYCELSGVPIMTYDGSSKDLAAICGKPFLISALSIKDPGDSEIIKLIEKRGPEESNGGTE